MNWAAWLAGRLRYEFNELIAPSPKDNFEFRNEPWHDETCLHRQDRDWAWELATGQISEDEAFNRALAEAMANDNQHQGQKL